ncbi:hypothetical protein [Pseudorhodoferax sp.]|uniref:hypothetical protein n=1 Tax=Pseudorhodoferax sp. TaxID=1993553 RepID=UPI002DD61C9F|nr:hypothetical protein [Pseudorhodoferax sp.]
MEGEFGDLLLLLLGPAGGVGLYIAIYRHYRNTDKSHGYEHETQVEASPIQASDRRIDAIRGTREPGIRGRNSDHHRQRVQRLN